MNQDFLRLRSGIFGSRWLAVDDRFLSRRDAARTCAMPALSARRSNVSIIVRNE
jgi:hypothetical protein